MVKSTVYFAGVRARSFHDNKQNKIADGLQGDNFREVAIDRKHFRRVMIAGEIASAGCYKESGHGLCSCARQGGATQR